MAPLLDVTGDEGVLLQVFEERLVGDLAEDRDLFRTMMARLGIPMPESGMAATLEEATTPWITPGGAWVLLPNGRAIEQIVTELFGPE